MKFLDGASTELGAFFIEYSNFWIELFKALSIESSALLMAWNLMLF